MEPGGEAPPPSIVESPKAPPELAHFDRALRDTFGADYEPIPGFFDTVKRLYLDLDLEREVVKLRGHLPSKKGWRPGVPVGADTILNWLENEAAYRRRNPPALNGATEQRPNSRAYNNVFE